jgi:hypothetical protein
MRESTTEILGEIYIPALVQEFSSWYFEKVADQEIIAKRAVDTERSQL